MSLYAIKEGKKLRCGYTTGSCAAAAAKAAALLALGQDAVPAVQLQTPRGEVLTIDIVSCQRFPRQGRCTVRKDAGDDPDITDGVQVAAHVSLTSGGIVIAGGPGIGRVTKPGLSCPVGEWAINPVPRQMIRTAVEDIARQCGYTGGFAVTISIPGGEELARKTFNPRLGIEGGLSVLGTTGIVEPMSERALVETIHREMDSRRAAGEKHILAFFGNYGVDFSRDVLQIDTEKRVTISNYVGEALDYGAYCGFSDLLLIGHAGKLIKVAQGIMNTHSRYADGRTSFLALAAMLHGASPAVGQAVYDSVTTDEALRIIQDEGLLEPVMALACRKIAYYMEQRVHGALRTGALLFSNVYGVLGYAGAAGELLTLHRQRSESL